MACNEQYSKVPNSTESTKKRKRKKEKIKNCLSIYKSFHTFLKICRHKNIINPHTIPFHNYVKKENYYRTHFSPSGPATIHKPPQAQR